MGLTGEQELGMMAHPTQHGSDTVFETVLLSVDYLADYTEVGSAVFAAHLGYFYSSLSS